MGVSNRGEIPGGYLIVTPTLLGNALHQYLLKHFSLFDFQVYLAVLMAKDARRVARINRARHAPAMQEVVTVRELQSIVAAFDGSRVLSSLRRLRRSGVIAFEVVGDGLSRLSVLELPLPAAGALIEKLSCKRSETRKIPIPRRIVRYLVRGKGRALTLTLLGYLLRSLAFGRDSIKFAGTCKAGWVADVFGLSVRSVHRARAELIGQKLISEDQTLNQWKLNRCGPYFEINLAFKEAAAAAVENSSTVAVNLSAPRAQNGAVLSGPIIETKNLLRNRYQKTQIAGVYKKTPRKESSPCLSNIVFDDLRCFSRAEELFRQAVSRGWFDSTQSNFLNFIACCIRAREVTDAANSPRVFVGLIKEKRWSHITQAQEDRAREVIRKYGESHATAMLDRLGLNVRGILAA